MERLFSNIQRSTQELRTLASHFKETGNSFLHDKLFRIANQIDTSAEEINHFSKVNNNKRSAE